MHAPTVAVLAMTMFGVGCAGGSDFTAVQFDPLPTVSPAHVCPGDAVTASWGVTAPATVRVRAFRPTSPTPLLDTQVHLGGETSYVLDIPAVEIADAAGQTVTVSFNVLVPYAPLQPGATTSFQVVEDGEAVTRTLTYVASDAPRHTYSFTFDERWGDSIVVKRVTLEGLRVVECRTGYGYDRQPDTDDDTFETYDLDYRVRKRADHAVLRPGDLRDAELLLAGAAEAAAALFEVDRPLTRQSSWNTGTALGDGVPAAGTWEFILENGPEKGLCKQAFDEEWIADRVVNTVTFELGCAAP